MEEGRKNSAGDWTDNEGLITSDVGLVVYNMVFRRGTDWVAEARRSGGLTIDCDVLDEHGGIAVVVVVGGSVEPEVILVSDGV